MTMRNRVLKNAARIPSWRLPAALCHMRALCQPSGMLKTRQPLPQRTNRRFSARFGTTISLPALLLAGAPLLALPTQPAACSEAITVPVQQHSSPFTASRGLVAFDQWGCMWPFVRLVDIAGRAVEMLRCVLRCLQLLSLALPPMIWLPFHTIFSCAATRHDSEMQSSNGLGGSLMIRLLCNALERAGPTAIKLGQWASTRPDLFEPELCNHFSARLHAAVTPHSAAHSREAVEAVLSSAGLTLEDVFEDIDFNAPPLGSGCVAQVHRATLCSDVARRAWAQARADTQASVGLHLERQEDLRQVVVKILHPGVSESVALDMKLLEFGASFITHWLSMLPMLAWVKLLRLPELTSEFKQHLQSQLDLRSESENLLQFQRNFAGRLGRHTIDEAVFPTPLAVLPVHETDTTAENLIHTKDLKWCSATPTVLVESLEPGVGLDRWLVDERQTPIAWCDPTATDATLLADQSIQDQHGHERQQREQMRRCLAESGVVAFFQMVLVDNFVHADLHPGNILLRNRSPDGLSSTGVVTGNGTAVNADCNTPSLEAPTLVFLDAGLVVRLSEKEKQNFCDLFLAVARGQGSRAGELIIDRSPGGRDAVKRSGGDPDRFIKAIAAVVDDVAARKFHLGSVAIGPVLLAVLSAVRMDRVPLDPAFGNLVSAIVVLEGIGRQLHPGLDLFGVAVPMLANHAVRHVTGGG